MLKKKISFISILVMTLLFSLFLANSPTVSAATTQTGQWGGATWSLDSGALSLSGNIGSPSINLAISLSNAGVNASAVTSLSFTNQTSGTNVYQAFGNLPDLTAISNLGNLNWSGPTDCFFAGDSSLNNINFSGFNTSNITDMTYMFLNDTAMKSLDLSSFNTQNVTSMYGMFDGDSGITNLNVSDFNTDNVRDFSFMFYGNTSLSNLNVSNFDTSNATTVYGMFDDDSSLASIDVSNFDTSNIKEMSDMFANDSSLTSLNLSAFDTSNADSMSQMFESDPSLKSLDLSNFNTANVTNMSAMFASDPDLSSVNLSSFNTSNVTTMYALFDQDSSLKTLDLSNFDTSNVTDMSYMFWGTNSLDQLILGAKTNLNKNTNLSLPNVPTTNGYTGNWQNVGTGTVTNPTGNNIWTSAQLMANYAGGAQADTYVWQSASTMSLGAVNTFENDPLYTYSGATKPLHPYRYYTVLNNDYPYYSSLTQGQDASQNIVSLGDKTGATVYEQKTMPVTYTSGPNAGQTQTFAYISFDGSSWYWVDVRELNSDIEYGSIELFNGGIDYSGVKDFYQLVENSFNPSGQIIYQSAVTLSDFSSFSDPAAAMATYNANLDEAAQRWNQAIGQTVFVKADGSQPVTLKIVAGSGDAYGNGQANVDTSAVTYGNNAQAYNPLLAGFTHELGHALGLDHTGGGSYYGDPYTFSDSSDVMWATMSYDPTSGYTYGQIQNITQNDVNAVKLIIQNQDFENFLPS